MSTTPRKSSPAARPTWSPLHAPSSTIRAGSGTPPSATASRSTTRPLTLARASISGRARSSRVPKRGRTNRSLGEEAHATTRGGEHVLIRPARAEDMALYADFLRDVSTEDLRLRFFARVGELSSEELRKFEHLDAHEMLFVALDENTDRMLGLVRLKDELDEQTAEFAILVRSSLKGHGLGWLLMQRVIDYAKEKRLRRGYWGVFGGKKATPQKCAGLVFPAR